MAVAVALWSLAVTPSKRVKFTPQADLRVVNVALGDELADPSGRTSVKVTYKNPVHPDDNDDEQPALKSTTVLCSLTPGKIEQAVVDLILEEDEEFVFETVGKNTVYLTGNYIDQQPQDDPPYNESDEEDAYDLQEVSSDVEMNPDELESDEGRFEEIADDIGEAANSRKRNSEAMEADEANISSAEQKLSKRLKAENGQGVTTPAEGAVTDAKAHGDEKKDKKQKKKEKKKAKKEGKETDKDQPEKDAAAPKATTNKVAGSIKIEDCKTGTGPQAKKGNTVSMRYIGKLENGKVFDKNTKGKPFTFRLGEGEVIKGWDEGIVGMQVGGERILTIPPHMGYGKKKTADIPANSVLTFECKLLEIK